MRKFLISLIVAITIISAPMATKCASLSVDNDCHEVAQLICNERTKVGLDSYTWDDELASDASIRVKESSTYFSHTRPDGQAWWTAGFNKSYAENLSKVRTKSYDCYSPADVVGAFMVSPEHKENILWTTFKSIGVAKYIDDSGELYYAVEFGY